MKLMAAALVLALTLAVTASVFAIWPVVAHAPWESTTTQPLAAPTATYCERMIAEMANAQTELAAQILIGPGTQHGCW